MRNIDTLLQDALTTCGGSRQALADRMGIKRSEASDLVARKRALSPEHAATLAEIVNATPSEAQRLALIAICENPKNAEKASMLRRVFGLPKHLSQKAKATALDVSAHCRKLSDGFRHHREHVAKLFRREL